MKRLWYAWKHRRVRREIVAYHRAGRVHPSEIGKQFVLTHVDPVKVSFKMGKDGIITDVWEAD